jgi:hypothetical protein
MRGEGQLIKKVECMERRYIVKPHKLSFGYYDERAECFSAQVDFLALGTDNAVMVTDVGGSKLLATNPDLTCELPFLCWCLEDIIPLLEIHNFIPLEGETI